MKSACFASSWKTVLTSIVILLPAVLNAEMTMAQMLETSNLELQELIQNEVPVIDVRTAGEWRMTGIIEDSHLLTFFDSRGNYNVEDWMGKLTTIVNQDDQVVLICAVGNRSAVIGKFLSSKMGFNEVYNVTGGIMSWIRQGYPVTRWP